MGIVVGVTGPPNAGKSTFVDRLAVGWRRLSTSKILRELPSYDPDAMTAGLMHQPDDDLAVCLSRRVGMGSDIRTVIDGWPRAGYQLGWLDHHTIVLVVFDAPLEVLSGRGRRSGHAARVARWYGTQYHDVLAEARRRSIPWRIIDSTSKDALDVTSSWIIKMATITSAQGDN